MARCEVVQVQCDRCKRIELRAPTPPGQGERKAALTLDFNGKKLVFDDMCQSCTDACKRIATDLEEWDREIKQKLGPTVSTNTAPPLQVAPNYSPPQPHSAAAAKR